MNLVVAKVGGSLFNLPDLKARIRAWTKHQKRPVLFVPGGGAMVEAIRELDHMHRLSDEAAHRLAIEAMALNGRMLAGLLGIRVVESAANVRAAVLDPTQFCRGDATLPHNWDVTSDSIAARVAVAWRADELVLLKSKSPDGTVEDWAKSGYCDPWMPRALAGSHIAVSAVNLREFAG